jgi:hypothetical protein
VGRKELALKHKEPGHADDAYQHVGYGIQRGAYFGPEVKCASDQPVQNVAKQAGQQEPFEKSLPPAKDRPEQNRSCEQPGERNRIGNIPPHAVRGSLRRFPLRAFLP